MGFQPGLETIGNVVVSELLLYRFCNLLQCFLSLATSRFEEFLYLFIGIRLQSIKHKIIKLTFDLEHTQTVRQGQIDVPCFNSNTTLLNERKILYCAHIVEAVSKLDNDNSKIFCHREKHFHKVLRLLLFPTVKLHSAQFGNTIHEFGNFFTEFFCYLIVRSVGILYTVV